MSLAFSKSLANRFWNDQHGFIVSAELVLVATIAVLAMVVGLSEVALNINNELEDVGSAFGSMSQAYSASGFCGHKGHSEGSKYKDKADFCDGPSDIQSSGARGE
jgi:hypothetical protein